jgi:hypothetical protein
MLPVEPLKTPRPPVSDILPRAFPKTRKSLGDFCTSAESTGFQSGPIRKARDYKLILFCWGASLVDALVGLGISLIMLCLASMILHSGFHHLIHFFRGSLSFFLTTAFVFTVGLYKVLLRSFLGFTFGDWAWGLRLGDEKSQKRDDYIARVWLRFFVVFGSGVLVLPALSLILGEDLAGHISGLYMHQRTDFKA